VILARGLLCFSRTSVNCRIDQPRKLVSGIVQKTDRSLLRTSITQTLILIQNRSAICRDRETRVKRPTTRVAIGPWGQPQGIVRAVGGACRCAPPPSPRLPSAELLQPHLHVLDKTGQVLCVLLRAGTIMYSAPVVYRVSSRYAFRPTCQVFRPCWSTCPTGDLQCLRIYRHGS
jgi:hypothetical protein